jgi:N-acetylmuramoyl-L-alanine amidase
MVTRWRPRRAALAVLLVLSPAIVGCSSSSGQRTTTAPVGAAVPDAPSSAEPSGTTVGSSRPASAVEPAGPVTGTPSATTVTSSAAPDVAPAEPLAAGSLTGKVIAIDPGHNGANGRHPSVIDRQVAIGNGHKECDTTGTETNAGYTESAFTLDVATRAAALLRAAGATVVLTRTDDKGVGPCITERAAIGNHAHADAAISIHGDGAPASGYGFHVIVPLGIGSNDAIVTPSRALGARIRDAFRAGTGEPLSSYTGTTSGGLVARNDLGGLNLSTVPKVFIECGNMRNATDAHRMTSAAWRQRAAQALAAGLARYVIAG